MKLQITKIRSGWYRIYEETSNRYFEVIRIDVYSEGESKRLWWHLLEDTNSLDGYLNTFVNKRQAIEAIVRLTQSGAQRND